MSNEKTTAYEIVTQLLTHGYTLSTAESCTGGTIASTITSIAGCSAVFTGSVIAYCNKVKANVLGVKESTLENHGAVSEETVREMVAGVQRVMGTDCAIATSGIAGPGGGTAQKPVGTVWIAVAVHNKITTLLLQTGCNNREENIKATVNKALATLKEAIAKE